MSLGEFIRRNFAEWIDSPSWKDSLLFLQGTISTAYFYLAVGDIKTYTYQRALADYFYRRYCLQRWNPKRKNPDDPDYRHTVPPLETIARSVVVAIMRGYDPRFARPSLRRGLRLRLRLREPGVWRAARYELERAKRRGAGPLPVPLPEEKGATR